MGGRHRVASPPTPHPKPPISSIDCLPCCKCAPSCFFPSFWLRGRSPRCINQVHLHWWCSWYLTTWVEPVVGKGKARWWIFGIAQRHQALIGSGQSGRYALGQLQQYNTSLHSFSGRYALGGGNKVGYVTLASPLWARRHTGQTQKDLKRGAEDYQDCR